MDHDFEQEEHEAELVEFFDQIVVDNKGTRLSKYKKELLEQIASYEKMLGFGFKN